MHIGKCVLISSGNRPHVEDTFAQVARHIYPQLRILIMKINAQQSALSKAIQTRFKIENINYVTFRLNLRHLPTSG